MKDQEFVNSIQGKVVEKIVIGNEDDDLFVEIRFQDTTSCFIHIQPAKDQAWQRDFVGVERRQQQSYPETAVKQRAHILLSFPSRIEVSCETAPK